MIKKDFVKGKFIFNIDFIMDRTLKELIQSKNEIIRRNAMSILKTLLKNQ